VRLVDDSDWTEGSELGVAEGHSILGSARAIVGAFI